MFGRSANWKREEVPDHKFDFIDVRDYRSNSFLTRTRYILMWAVVIKSFAVYIADIYTAVTLIAVSHFGSQTSSVYQPDKTICPNLTSSSSYVPIEYAKWIFLGCIIFSFVLLAYETHKSRAIVRSRDISYAFTNVMANNWYSMRSYNHFCFFCQINNSKKKKDEFAFFIFFTFKGWKRLLVADGPRQTLNALALYNFVQCHKFSTEFSDYVKGSWTQAVLLLSMLFTVAVFVASLLLLVVACMMYVPLLCYIKGNLKEYCCHKIDKRISELIQHRNKQRTAKLAEIARKEAAGDFSHLKNKRGEIVGTAMQQPTLPTLDIDVLNDSPSSAAAATTPGVAGSVSGGKRSRPGSIGSSIGGTALMHETDPAKLGYYGDSPGFGPMTFHGPTQAAAAAGLGLPPPPRSGSSMGSYPADHHSEAGGYADSHTHLMAYPLTPGSVSGSSPDTLPVRVRGYGGSSTSPGAAAASPWNNTAAAAAAAELGLDLPPPIMPAAAAEPNRAASPSPSAFGGGMGMGMAMGSPRMVPARIGSPSPSGYGAQPSPAAYPPPAPYAAQEYGAVPGHSYNQSLSTASVAGSQGYPHTQAEIQMQPLYSPHYQQQHQQQRYAPHQPSQLQALPQQQQQQPDLSAYMPYSEERYAPEPGYVQDGFGGVAQAHAEDEHAGDGGGGSSFFDQLNSHQQQQQQPTAQPVPRVHIETLSDGGVAPAHAHANAQLGGAGAGSRPVSFGATPDGSRHASVNFEDIYAQYDEPDHQAQGHAKGE